MAKMTSYWYCYWCEQCLLPLTYWLTYLMWTKQLYWWYWWQTLWYFGFFNETPSPSSKRVNWSELLKALIGCNLQQKHIWNQRIWKRFVRFNFHGDVLKKDNARLWHVFGRPALNNKKIALFQSGLVHIRFLLIALFHFISSRWDIKIP